MPYCNHNKIWKDRDNCLICAVDFVQKTEAPTSTRQFALERLLAQLGCGWPVLVRALERELPLADEIVSAVLGFYLQVGDQTLKQQVLEGVLQFIQHFGGRTVSIVASKFLQVDTDHPTTSSSLHVFTLLLDLANQVPALIDRLSLNDKIIFQISSCLTVPDDRLRSALFELAQMFAAQRAVKGDGSLETFCCLSQPVTSCLMTSDSVEVLLSACRFLHECAQYQDFCDWMLSSIAPPSDDNPPNLKRVVDDLFSAIKRLFLKQSSPLSLAAVQLLLTLVSLQNMGKPLLDSDLLGFVFDALKASTSEKMIQATYECILDLSKEELFYSSYHAVCGLTSICKSLSHLLSDNPGVVACGGYEVLQSLLENAPTDVPLLQTVSAFDHAHQSICDGITCDDLAVCSQAIGTACLLLQKHNLPHPVPFRDFVGIILKLEEAVLPRLNAMDLDASQVELSSQGLNEDLRSGFESVYSAIFQFLAQCCRLADDGSELIGEEENSFFERIVESLTKFWIPCVQENRAVLLIPSVAESFFTCLVCSLNPAFNCEPIFHFLILHESIELGLRVLTKPPLVESVVEFLCVMCCKFLHDIDCFEPKIRGLLQKGFVKFKGLPSELLFLLREFPVRDGSDEGNLGVFVAVISTLSMSAWFDQSLVSMNDLGEFLFRWVTKPPDMTSLPPCAVTMLLFLTCVCQQERSNPEIPAFLIGALRSRDMTYPHHPAVIGCLILTDDSIVSNDEKRGMIRRWLSDVDDSGVTFHSNPAVRHLMGLMLLHPTVSALVIECLTLSVSEAEAKKIILLVTGAIAESLVVENAESSQPEFVSGLCAVLPAFGLKYMTMDSFKSAPLHVSASFFDLLNLCVETGGFGESQSHSLLRQALSVTADGFVDDDISDVIVASLLHFMELLVTARTNPENPSDLCIVLSHTRFLPALQTSLSAHLSSPSKESSYLLSFELKFLAALVSLQPIVKAKVTFSLHIKVDQLLQFCYGDPRIECATLKLWTSLFDRAFKSPLLVVEAPAPELPRVELLDDYDVTLAPLNHEKLMTVFLSAANSAIKDFTGIRLNALRCLLAMLDYLRHVIKDPDLVGDVGASPWLRVAVQANAVADTDPMRKVCAALKEIRDEIISASGDPLAEFCSAEDQAEADALKINAELQNLGLGVEIPPK